MLSKSFPFLLAVVCLGVIGAPESSAAPDCSTKACISVTTNSSDGAPAGITIIATQNSPGSTPAPKIVKKKAKPHKSILHKPIDQIIKRTIPRLIPLRPIMKAPHKIIVKRIIHTTPKLVKKKIALPVPPAARTVRPKIVAAVSLSDTLTQLLPNRAMYYQPIDAAIVQVPVYFWTDTNPLFQSTSLILGITVGVILTPTFNWDFGDGSQLTTFDRGGTFPTGKITHTYRTFGKYMVKMSISWSGTWNANGNSYPVLGQVIVQQVSTTIDIHPAPTRIND
jgi:hypothetical protein